MNDNNTPLEEPDNNSAREETIPVGIARLRKEWRDAGLTDEKVPKPIHEEVKPVVFSEIDGGAGIGDYILDSDTVRDKLVLSQDAMDRLIDSGELDSVLVQASDGQPRRLISESSFNRFQEDSAIDPEALKRAAKAMTDQTVAESLDQLRDEIAELKGSQGKILQQMKDMLLLEIRNLKEQDRDLTSFVYELAEEIKSIFPKKRK